MSYDYRVFRKKHFDFPPVTYYLCEVYFNDNGEITGWDELRYEPYGETLDIFREKVRCFLHAFRYPVLEEKETEKGQILVPRDQEKRVKDWTYIELVDRASVAIDSIHLFLGSHPLVLGNHVLEDMCNLVCKTLDLFLDEVSRLESGIDRADLPVPLRSEILEDTDP